MRTPRRVIAIPNLEGGYPWEDTPEGTLIDAALAPIIDLFNNHLGVTTRFCCSGLPEDHGGETSYCSFYIYFAEPPAWAMKLFTSRGFKRDGSETVRWRAEYEPLRAHLRDIEAILLDMTRRGGKVAG